jgi:hypothetical protein
MTEGNGGPQVEEVHGVEVHIQLTSSGEISVQTNPPEAVNSRALVYGILEFAKDALLERQLEAKRERREQKQRIIRPDGMPPDLRADR